MMSRWIRRDGDVITFGVIERFVQIAFRMLHALMFEEAEGAEGVAVPVKVNSSN